jgi:hypothetical protein
MVECVESDPQLRGRYQFWLFSYESGDSIPFLAHQLRLSLRRARLLFDPKGKDEALDSVHPPSRQNRYAEYICVDKRYTHACRSGSPMPRANRIQAFCGRSLLSGLVLATGCAHSQTDLQDRLARRVVPTATEPVPSANPVEGSSSVRPTADGGVRLAGDSQPGQSTEARTGNDRTTPLPPAIVGSSRRSGSDRPSSPATSLPSDSDEATLDAIAANGKPLTVRDAIDLAYRSQPRLRAQLESIAQARGAQQIAFSAFLPVVAGRYDVGGFSLGAGGLAAQVGKPQNFNFCNRLAG